MNPPVSATSTSKLLSLPVIVAALGYFVDIYDLLLFNIVRVESLQSMGLSPEQISKIGATIISYQSAGLLIGGVLWGVLGDKRGRLSVLFGSIVTYSLANIACGFVTDPTMYAWLRFLAGIGLAGELGAGITLVSETVPKEQRGYASSIVAGVGIFGAVLAYFMSQWFDWRTAYFIGGGLGLGLLVLRVNVFESSMYQTVKDSSVSRGNFFELLTNGNRLARYLKCIGIALPIWFIIGILCSFGNEIAKGLGIVEPITPGLCIMYGYTGLALGDLGSGFISQKLRSRRNAVILLMTLSLIGALVMTVGGLSTAQAYYNLCFLTGLAIGYWAMFMAITAEQFGTNLRATATTTVPNMVRGALIPMTMGFQYFKPTQGAIGAALIVGSIAFVLGYWSIFTMEETFGKDLDFLEE
jgi:MFS family permease